MKKNLILPVLFLFILLTTSLAGAIGEQRMFWASADIHVDIPPTVSKNVAFYYKMINDTMNNITPAVHIYFSIGDNVDSTELGLPNAQWDAFHGAFETIQALVYKNYSIGDHEGYVDGRWWLHTYGGMAHANWTFTYGNILFIVISQHEKEFANYERAYPFLNETVQANQDKNIIVLSHHPLENTTNNTWGGYDTMLRDKGGSDCIWLCMNYNISMWITGNNHLPGNYTKTTQHIYGTLFANAGSAALNLDGNTGKDYFANWGGSTKAVDSLFVNFTKGSQRISIQRRNHNTSSWYTDQYMNVTPDDQWLNDSWLDYPFILGTSPTFENLTIANQSHSNPIATTNYFNVTVNDTDGDTFNWTIQLSNGNESWGNLSSNGTIPCQINLTNNTIYTVWVNATDDGVTWVNETYWFTTTGYATYLEATIHKSTFDEVGIGNDIFNIIGLVLIIGAILGIIGVVVLHK